MDHLAHVAAELVKLLDKQADTMLPQKIADVVKLHSKLGVASAWIPVPGVDMAAGAANIWSMYVRINNKIGLSVKDNVLKTVASGVATNLAGYVAITGAASALKFIHGLGTLTSALLMSATQYALLIVSGWVYLKALCVLAEKSGPILDMSKLSSAVKEVLIDSSIKELMEQAKKEHKKIILEQC